MPCRCRRCQDTKAAVLLAVWFTLAAWLLLCVTHA